MTAYIKAGMVKVFPEYEELDDSIDEKIKRKRNNWQHRKKRFCRKAYLNRWNRFLTITYDDKKHTEETFRKKLRKCLSNLHTRRGWKYMQAGRLQYRAGKNASNIPEHVF